MNDEPRRPNGSPEGPLDLRSAREVDSKTNTDRDSKSLQTNVLVIDDSDTARAGMTRLLLSDGYLAHELSSAIGATRTILRERIQIVIVDVSMPGLSGDKLVAVLRKNVAMAKVIIVMVSGDEKELVRISELTAIDAVLPKSEVQRELLPMLRRLLAARGMRAPGTMSRLGK